MLENIKLMLGLDLNNENYDPIIKLLINKITNSIYEYCNIHELTTAIESFIEDKIYTILKLEIANKNNASEVKSINRGDTSITYNTSNSVSINDVLKSYELSSDDKKVLNKYRKLKFR